MFGSNRDKMFDVIRKNLKDKTFNLCNEKCAKLTN